MKQKNNNLSHNTFIITNLKIITLSSDSVYLELAALKTKKGNIIDNLRSRIQLPRLQGHTALTYIHTHSLQELLEEPEFTADLDNLILDFFNFCKDFPLVMEGTMTPSIDPFLKKASTFFKERYPQKNFTCFSLFAIKNALKDLNIPIKASDIRLTKSKTEIPEILQQIIQQWLHIINTLEQESFMDLDNLITLHKQYENIIFYHEPQNDKFNSEMNTPQLITFQGQIISSHAFTITENERYEVHLDLTDFFTTISVVFILNSHDMNFRRIWRELCIGRNVRINGYQTTSHEDSNILTELTKIEIIECSDIASTKRIELCCPIPASTVHNQIVDIDTLIRQSLHFGHTSLAITEYCNINYFTETRLAIQKIQQEYETLNKPFHFKLIYGIEAELVDDLTDVISNCTNKPLENSFVAFEIKTINQTSRTGKIREIAATKIKNGCITDSFYRFIVHNKDFQEMKQENISLCFANEEDALQQFFLFCKDAILVGHDIDNIKNLPYFKNHTIVDTKRIAMAMIPKKLCNYTLKNVANHMKISLSENSDCTEKTEGIAKLYNRFLIDFRKMSLLTLQQVNDYCQNSTYYIKHLPVFQGTLLIKNRVGFKNLLNLIKTAHTTHFYIQPIFSMRLLSKHREGLLVGSGNARGLLFHGLFIQQEEETLKQLAKYFDYFEIQPEPKGKLIIHDRYLQQTISATKKINKQIVELGKYLNRPVIANGNMPWQKIETQENLEQCIVDFKYDNVRSQIYIRTTDEMLAAFQYLGKEKATEVVINNTQQLAALIENNITFSDLYFPTDSGVL